MPPGADEGPLRCGDPGHVGRRGRRKGGVAAARISSERIRAAAAPPALHLPRRPPRAGPRAAPAPLAAGPSRPRSAPPRASPRAPRRPAGVSARGGAARGGAESGAGGGGRRARGGGMRLPALPVAG